MLGILCFLTQAFCRQSAVAREFGQKLAAIREPPPEVVHVTVEGGDYSVAGTPRSHFASAAEGDSSTLLSEVSSASPLLAAAFGLSSAKRDAGSSPKLRSLSMDSPRMPTLLVIHVSFV